MKTETILNYARSWFMSLSPTETEQKVIGNWLDCKDVINSWIKEVVIPWWRIRITSENDDFIIKYGNNCYTDQEIASIYIQEHPQKEETSLPKTVEEAASNLTNFIKNEALPESKQILTELKLINATNNLAKSKVIISELLDALLNMDGYYNTPLMDLKLKGWKEEDRKEIKNITKAAITKAETCLNQK